MEQEQKVMEQEQKVAAIFARMERLSQLEERMLCFLCLAIPALIGFAMGMAFGVFG